MNIDAIRTSLTALGLPEAAIEAAVTAALATGEREQAQADLDTATAALAAARARALAAGIITGATTQTQHHTGRPSRGTPRECACGCGNTTRGGTWMPGHDAKNGGHKARIAAQLAQ